MGPRLAIVLGCVVLGGLGLETYTAMNAEHVVGTAERIGIVWRVTLEDGRVFERSTRNQPPEDGRYLVVGPQLRVDDVMGNHGGAILAGIAGGLALLVVATGARTW